MELDLPEANLPIADMLDGLRNILQTPLCESPSKTTGHWQIYFFMDQTTPEDFFKGKVWKLPTQTSFPYTQTNRQGKPKIHYGNEIKGKPTDKLTLHGADRAAFLFDFLLVNYETQGTKPANCAKLLADENPNKTSLPTAKATTTKPLTQGKQTKQQRTTKRKAQTELANICAEISASGKYLTVEQLAPKAFRFHALTNGKEGIKRKLEDACSDFNPDTRARAVKQIAFYEQTHNEQFTYRIFDSLSELRSAIKEEKKPLSRPRIKAWENEIRSRKKWIQYGANYVEIMPDKTNPNHWWTRYHTIRQMEIILTNDGINDEDKTYILKLFNDCRADQKTIIHYAPAIMHKPNGQVILNDTEEEIDPPAQLQIPNASLADQWENHPRAEWLSEAIVKARAAAQARKFHREMNESDVLF